MATHRMYRIDGMTVHASGTKLPKACVAEVWAAGASLSPLFPAKGPSQCMAPSEYLCDWPVGDKRETCDRALCEAHAMPVGKNRHYCPAHLAEHKAAQPQLGLFTSLVQTTKEKR